MRKFQFFVIVLVSLASFVSNFGCNVFDPFDNPTTDPQILSKARSCFDQGDLACAKEFYGRVSAANSDTAISEMVYTILEQQNITMQRLLEFLGNGAKGSAVNKFAEALTPDAGEAKRLAIIDAYTQTQQIQDKSLKAFVEFLTTLALVGEILAETANTDKVLQKTDYVAAATCKVGSGLTSCVIPTNTACEGSSGSKLGTTAADAITATAFAGATPSLDQLFLAFQKASSSLQTLSPGGSFSSTSSGFSDIISQGKPSDSAAIARCFRAQMIAFEIGI